MVSGADVQWLHEDSNPPIHVKPMLLMVEQPVGVLKSKSRPNLPFLINKPNGGVPTNSREEAGFAFKEIVLIDRESLSQALRTSVKKPVRSLPKTT